MSNISPEDLARFIDGKMEDPAELQRVLDHLAHHPEGEASRQLRQTQTLAETALDITWGKLIRQQDPWPDRISRMNQTIQRLQTEGRYREATQTAERTYALACLVLGEKNARSAAVLNNLGNILRALDQYAEAKSCYERALIVTRNALGEDHAQTGTLWHNLGYVHVCLGDYLEAEIAYQRALTIRRTALGEEHRDVGQTLNNLGLLYKTMGDYPSARTYLEQALHIWKAVLGEDHHEVATCLGNLASLSQAEGDYAVAEALCRQALEIDRRALGETHPSVAIDLSNLALTLKLQGNYAAAEPLYQQALEVKHRTVGEDHLSYAVTLSNLANLYDSMGDHAQAERLFRRVLELRRRKLGEKHPQVATSMNDVATMCRKLKQYAEAEALYQQALAMQLQVYKQPHPAIARIHNNLGRLFEVTQDYAKAQEYYALALTIRRQTLGTDHPDTAQSFNNLGHLLLTIGDFTAAEPLFHENLDIKRRTVGERHPSYAIALHNLARLQAATGRGTEAARLLSQALAIEDETLTHIFAIGSAQQRQAFLGTIRTGLETFLSLIYHFFLDSPAHMRLAYDVVLRRKAVEREPLLADRNTALAAKYPVLRDRLDRLTDLNKQIALKKLATPTAGTAHIARRLVDQWEEELRQLETQLGSAIPELAAESRFRTATRWVVASALPINAPLIEYVRFRVFAFQAISAQGESRWQPARYAAFVLPPGEPESVSMVDLGEADAIDQMIAEFRAALEPPSKRKIGVALRSQVFDKPLAALGEPPRLVIAPDGGLSSFAMEELPSDGGERLGAKHEFVYLGVGRDAVRAA